MNLVTNVDIMHNNNMLSELVARYLKMLTAIGS